jgi:stress response protein SCP2
MPQVTTGQRVKLNVTEKAKHRVMAGLGWDPATDMSFLDKINDVVAGKKSYHDLDLCCFLYNQDKEIVSHVSADPGQGIDHTGKVYHSGDNVEGYGDGDDEEISIELLDLNDSIHHIIITAEIRTGHDFTEISGPEIRLADGYSNHNFLQRQLDTQAEANMSAYVFAHLYRADNGWMLHYVDQYAKRDENVQKWISLLGDFLTEK